MLLKTRKILTSAIAAAASATSIVGTMSTSAVLAASSSSPAEVNSGGENLSNTKGQKFSISTSAGKGGTITPSKINVDGTQSYKIIVNAETGYRIAGVIIDNESQLIPDGMTRFSKTFEGLDADHTVTATFVKNTDEQYYRIRTSSDVNGTITPSLGEVAASGQYNILVKANDNYVLDKVLDNGVPLRVENNATKFVVRYDKLTADHDIIATFKHIDKTNSAMNPDDQNPRYYSVTAESFTDDGTNPNNAGTFELVSSDKTLSASDVNEDKYGKVTQTYKTVQEWSKNNAIVTAKNGYYIKEVMLDNGDMLASGGPVTERVFDKNTGKVIAEYVKNPREYIESTDLDGKTTTEVITTAKDGKKTSFTFDGTEQEARAQEDEKDKNEEAEHYANGVTLPVVRSFYLDQKSLLSAHKIKVVYGKVKDMLKLERGKITAYVSGSTERGTVKVTTDESGKRTVTIKAAKYNKFKELKVDGKTVKCNGKTYSFPASDYDSHEVAVYFTPVVGFVDSTVKLHPGQAYTEWIKNSPKALKWSFSGNASKVFSYQKWGKSIRIKAKAPGTATVYGKVDGKTYKFKVSVTQYSLNKKKATLRRGATLPLKVKDGKNIKWYSSNKRVATVSSSGKVKAVRKGKATITASLYGQKIKCTVTVK